MHLNSVFFKKMLIDFWSFKIYDPSKERYEVPINLYRPDKLTDITKSVARFDGTVNSKTGLFEFKIVRKENNEVM